MTELFLIGIGTGNPGHLTGEGRRTIAEADLILIPRKGPKKSDLADLRHQIVAHVCPDRSAPVAEFDLPTRDPDLPYLEAVERWHDAIALIWAETIASTPVPTMTIVSAASISVKPEAVRRIWRFRDLAIWRFFITLSLTINQFKSRFGKYHLTQTHSPAVITVTTVTDRQTARSSNHFTSVDSLKIGRMIAIAMNPTTEPIPRIMIGSIMLVTALIWSFSCAA